MRARILLAALVAAVATFAFTGVAAAAPPADTNANGCVGTIVSSLAHFFAGLPGPGGLGTAGKDLGVNLGEAIRQAAAALCDKH